MIKNPLDVKVSLPDSKEKSPFQTKFIQLKESVIRLSQEKKDQLTNQANGDVYGRKDIIKYLLDLIQTAESTNKLIADGVIEDPAGTLADLETNFDTAIAFTSIFLVTAEQPVETIESKRELVREKFGKMEAEVRKFKTAQRKLSPWRQSFAGRSKLEFIDLIAKLGQAADQIENNGGVAAVRMQMDKIDKMKQSEIDHLRKILDDVLLPYKTLSTDVLNWVKNNINVFPPNWPVDNLFDDPSKK